MTSHSSDSGDVNSTRTVITRRQALGALGILGLATQVGFAAEKKRPAQPKQTGIALQLYTLRE